MTSQKRMDALRYTRFVFLTFSLLSIQFLLSACQGEPGKEVLPSSHYYPLSIHADIKTIQESDSSYILSAQFRTGTTEEDSYLRLSGNDFLIASEDGPVTELVDISDDFFNNGVELSNSLTTSFQVKNLYRSTSCTYVLDCIFGRLFEGIFFFIPFNDVDSSYKYTGEPEYYTYLEPPFSPSIYLSFMRSKNSIAEASLTMPEPFEISMPNHRDSFNRNSDITVTWSPISLAGDNMQVIATLLDCPDEYIDPNTNTPLIINLSGDPGTYTFTAIQLQTIAPSTSSSCDLEIRVERSRAGNIHNFRYSSTAIGIQRRSVILNWQE